MSKEKPFPKYNLNNVIDTLLDDPDFCREVEQYAISINAPKKELLAKSKKIFRELASSYKKPGIYLSGFCIKLISTFFFSGITTYGDLDHLKDDRYQYLYLPSHRSHMDYLFISYMLFRLNVAPPHIAAGINLSFFPMGMIFRRLGAFFIRRRISGNFLYLQCLKTYLRWLLHYPLGIELFIEGGRSRDGKIRKPQTGILQLIFESLDKAPSKPYKIVPISMTYDFTPEASSYAQEEQGKNKKKETLFSLLQSATRLEKYHGCHIHILEPMDVQNWVKEHGRDKSSIQKLSQLVLQNIQSHTVVTPYHMTACAITALSQPLFEDDLYQTCLQIKQYLTCQNVTFSAEAQHFEQNFPTIIDCILKKGWINRLPGFRYQISPVHQVTLNYYKYSILHFFVPALWHLVGKDNYTTTTDIIAHEFPVLAESYITPSDSDTSPSGVIETAKSIFTPYREVIKALYKESLDKIVHSLSINPEQELSQKEYAQCTLTHQKIKHAYDFLSRKTPDEIEGIEHFLNDLCEKPNSAF